MLQREPSRDRFWVVFSLAPGGTALFPGDSATAQLAVRISDKEGRVESPIPPSLRERQAGVRRRP